MGYMLCVTCANEKGCTYLNGRKQVLQCEEFAGMRPKARRPARRPRRRPEVEQALEYRGLCRVCDLRVKCRYRKPGQIVQLCEEYS